MTLVGDWASAFSTSDGELEGVGGEEEGMDMILNEKREGAMKVWDWEEEETCQRRVGSSTGNAGPLP